MDDSTRTTLLEYISRLLNSGTGKKKSLEYLYKFVNALPAVEPTTKVVAQVNVDAEDVVRRIKEEYDIVDGWIPCEERLPEANEKDEQGFHKAYLVQNFRWIHTARWDGTHWILWTAGSVLTGVTAWMPLPEPYMKGADDE